MVKILFEEVSFNASFECREGRAVTESERKRIPDLDSIDVFHAVFFCRRRFYHLKKSAET